MKLNLINFVGMKTLHCLHAGFNCTLTIKILVEWIFKQQLHLVIFILLFFNQSTFSQFRLVISSDFPPLDVIPGGAGYGKPHERSDPDDIQSMVRLLLYSNDFKVEGLIAASATVANIANKQNILDIIDVYDQVNDQLRLHDPKYPEPGALRKVTKQGLSGTYGQPSDQLLGEGKDSEASQFIIELVDKPDPSPIWFVFWGGTQEIAQALWRVKSSRTPNQIQQFVSKLRLYFIAHQDGTAQWLKDEFPDLFIIDNRKTFKGMFYNALGADTTLADSTWLYNNIIINHGPLGAIYPLTGWNHKAKGVVEGDSPSFLYLYSQLIGLSDPENPGMGSWGGRFIRQNEQTRHWEDAPETIASVTRWQEAFQADFAARMERCVLLPGAVNKPPKAVLNQDTSIHILYLKASPGQSVILNSKGSTDPGKNKLDYYWFHYKEAGNYEGELTIRGKRKGKAKVIIPRNMKQGSLHIILEVKNESTRPLTSYRRAIIEVN